MLATDNLEKYREDLQDFDKLDFNIFDLEHKIGSRRQVLPLMTHKAINNLGLLSCNFGNSIIEEAKLEKFLD